MHGVFHIKSSTAGLYTSRKEGKKGQHSIEKIVRQEEPSLKSYVSRKAKSDLLMAECKRLMATWKEPDEAAAWYEKPLHGAWHKGVSEVADMARTYQWLNKSNIRANTEALIMAVQEQALNTRAVAHESTTLCKIHDAGCANNMQKPWHISPVVAASSQGPSTLKDTTMWPQ